MSNSITREEILLSSIANEQNSNLSPITREEQYLSYIAGETNSLPSKPITRKEMYLDKIAKNGISGGGGSSAILVEKTITENGEYPAVNDGADGYSKVVVNVASGGETSFDAYVEGRTTEVNLPTATEIIDRAFYYHTNLTNITIPNVTSIGMGALANCSNLALIELPKVTSIGASAFYQCSSLASVEMPKVTSIGDSVFGNCTSLNAITFKAKPTDISATAFYKCTNLTTINVPWAEGEVANAPWGATNATINYNYTGE